MKCFLRAKKGKRLYQVISENPAVFAQRLASLKTQIKGLKVDLKVKYDNGGYNSGTYTNFKDLHHAYLAFTEG